MHTSSSSEPTFGSLLGAFFQWYFRTRTHFYNDDSWSLPWYFGALCWNYALAGLLMLWMEPKWIQQPQSLLGGRVFPYRVFAILVIFVQSPLSFLADYVHIHNDSYWHVVDRSLAVPLMGLELLRCCITAQQALHCRKEKGSLPLVGFYGLALVVALYSFGQSQDAQTNLDREGFIFWHNVWHLYPLIASCIALYDYRVCGGWQRTRWQIHFHVHANRRTKPFDYDFDLRSRDRLLPLHT